MQRIASILAGWLIATVMASPGIAAPLDLTGYWTTGRNEAVTQIYSCGANLLCGELVGFPMDHASDAMPRTWNQQPQCHFVFIRYLHDAGESWSGTIIDPQSGHHYGADIRLVSHTQLRLRGYLLLPLLGATRFWTRYAGPPPPGDCRMAAHSLG